MSLEGVFVGKVDAYDLICQRQVIVTYFGFLLLFVGIPIALLAVVTWLDRRQGRDIPDRLHAWPAWAAVLLHVVIAVIYTTPWDNYLVATRVWWYEPGLVTGFTLGWVPIEEYTFFVVQTILAGLWLLFLARHLKRPAAAGPLLGRLRLWTFLVIAVPWIAALLVLLTGWQPGTYLALELLWALPPIMLQLAFGADILWRYRRLVSLAIIPLTLYLSAADAVAINLGTWTISPSQSLELLIGGVLPVEEFLFFLLTNTLTTFGIVLVTAQESHARFAQYRSRLSSERASIEES